MLSRRGLCSRPTYKGEESLVHTITKRWIGTYTALGATPHVRALSLPLRVWLRGVASAREEERARVRMEANENICEDAVDVRGVVRSDVVMLDTRRIQAAFYSDA